MSVDPGQDPNHDLVEDPQDDGRHPRIALGTFLSLLRVAAGRRGYASVAWNRFGFTYTVAVVREGASPDPVLDVDATALGLDEAQGKIRDAIAFD